MNNVVIGVRTDSGQREVNEDAYYIMEDRLSPEGPLLYGLYLVADVDSTDRMGEAASRLALSTIAQMVEPHLNHEHESFLIILKEAIKEAYKRLEELSSNEDWGDISLSLACALIAKDRLYYAVIGSCSLFQLRGDEFRELPRSILPKDGPIKSKDLEDLEIFETKLLAGDTLLLATDGLTRQMRVSDMADVLSWSVSAQAATDRLINLAKRSGGKDNITALVLDMPPEKKKGSGWWKIPLSLFGILILGFFLAYLVFSREKPAPSSSAAPTTTEAVERYRYIQDLRDPYSVVVQEKDLFVLDKEEKKVRKYTNGEEVKDYNGYLEGADAPCDLLIVGNSLYVLDAGGKFFTLDYDQGDPFMTTPLMGDLGQLSSPRALDYDGRRLYVADRGNDRIVILSLNFQALDVISGQREDGTSLIEKPNGLVIDYEGYIYISLKNRHEVIKIDRSGNLIASASTEATSIGTYDGPSDLALTYDGNVLVPEMSTNQILLFDPDLNLLSKINYEQLGDPAFRDPKGLCATEEALYVAGGSSDDLQGYVWRLPWSLFRTSP